MTSSSPLPNGDGERTWSKAVKSLQQYYSGATAAAETDTENATK